MGLRRRIPATAWAGAGAAATAGSQAAVVVVIARLAGAEGLGRYALAAAVAGPLMLLARMQLRTVVASEIGRADRRLAFLLTRAAAGVTAVAAAAFAAHSFFDSETAAVIVFLAAARVAEDLGELSWGFLQRQGRWRMIALSQTLHGVGAAAVILAMLAGGAGLPAALAGAFAAHLAVFVALDAPAAGLTPRRLGSLSAETWRGATEIAKECALLAPAAALVSLNGHLPRFALERWAGLEDVGRFAALVQLTLLGNLAVQAFGQASLARMARQAVESPAAFRRTLLRLTAAALAAAAAGLAASFGFGGPLLELMYGEELGGLGSTLTALMGAAGFLYLAGVWGYALAALGERRMQLPIYLAAVCVGAVTAAVCVPRLGLAGGVASYGAGWAAAAAGCAWGVRRRIGITRRSAGGGRTPGRSGTRLVGPEAQA